MPIIRETETSIVITLEKLRTQNREVSLSLSMVNGTPTLRFYVESRRETIEKFHDFLRSLGIFAVAENIGREYSDLFHYTITSDIAETIDQLKPYFNKEEYTALLAKFTHIVPVKKLDKKQSVPAAAFSKGFVACTEELAKIERAIHKIKQSLQTSERPLALLPTDKVIGFDKCSAMLKKLDDIYRLVSVGDRIKLFEQQRKLKLLKMELTAIEHFARIQWPEIHRINKPSNEGFPYFNPRKPISLGDKKAEAKSDLEQQARYISSPPSYMAEDPPGSGRYVQKYFKNDAEQQVSYISYLSRWVMAPLEKARKNLFSFPYDVFECHYCMYPLISDKEVEKVRGLAEKGGVLHLIKDELALAHKAMDDFEDVCKIMKNLTVLKDEGVDVEYLMGRIRPAKEQEAKESIVSQMRAARGNPLVSAVSLPARGEAAVPPSSSKPSQVEESESSCSL